MDRVFPRVTTLMLCIRARLQSGRKGPTKIRALAPGLFSAQNSFWASKFGQDTRIGFKPLLRRILHQVLVRGARAKHAEGKAYLHEGHGFSRAKKGLRTTALAAEVRFFDTYGATSSLPRQINKLRRQKASSSANLDSSEVQPSLR